MVQGCPELQEDLDKALRDAQGGISGVSIKFNCIGLKAEKKPKCNSQEFGRWGEQGSSPTFLPSEHKKLSTALGQQENGENRVKKLLTAPVCTQHLFHSPQHLR